MSDGGLETEPSPAGTPESEAIEEEKRVALLAAFSEATRGDPDLEALYLTVLDGITKRQDIAAALAWDPARVSAARIKLQRRLAGQWNGTSWEMRTNRPPIRALGIAAAREVRKGHWVRFAHGARHRDARVVARRARALFPCDRRARESRARWRARRDRRRRRPLRRRSKMGETSLPRTKRAAARAFFDKGEASPRPEQVSSSAWVDDANDDAELTEHVLAMPSLGVCVSLLRWPPD